MGCPSESEVDEVLDRVAPRERAQAVHAHVAACERCLAQFGASFELELWSGALGAETTEPARTASPWWQRARWRAAAAAAALLVVAGVGGRRWLAMERSTQATRLDAAAVSALPESPFLAVYALEFEQGWRGPNGLERRTARLDPIKRASIDYTEVRRDASGFEQRSRRTALLRVAATPKESP